MSDLNSIPPQTRTEVDAIGPVEVPAASYGGSFTTRALQNFQISDLRAPESFKTALALIKMSAAEVNADLGYLKPEYAAAIVQAGEEFLEGDFDADYDLDVYQAGAGTPFNMNLNEILANRANEILAEQSQSSSTRGVYKPLHPNNHVNMGQSSNDVTPTAIRLAALLQLTELHGEWDLLIAHFDALSEQFSDVLKVGRTHLQDAVPVTLGQEFWGYSDSIRHGIERLDHSTIELLRLGIGATATGSGINTHPEFAARLRARLGERMGITFEPLNPFENNNSLSSFLSVSSALRGLSIELLRICNDLRLMGSTALGELRLPEVEPGSSIMPGKVNPSVFECMSQICVQVMGLDHAIAISAQQGQFELNWYTPLVMWDLLHMIEILSEGIRMLRAHGLTGLECHREHMLEVLENSTAMATALAPHMGYHEVAELVNLAKREKVPFSTLVPEEYKKHLALDALTRPNLE